MKKYTDRYEIAKLLNFNKYPVLELDLATSKPKEDYYKGCYFGGKVRWVKHSPSGENYIWHGNLNYYSDSGLCITNDSACIKASFGYQDIKEDLEIANAPLIKDDCEVVVVIHDSVKRLACVCKTTIGKLDSHYSTSYHFEDDFKQTIKQLENAIGD